MFETNDCIDETFIGRKQIVNCLWALAGIFYFYGAPVPKFMKFQIINFKGSDNLVDIYFQYKKKNDLNIDIYGVMKDILPNVNIEDYKFKTEVKESEKENYEKIDLNNAIKNLTVSEKEIQEVSVENDMNNIDESVFSIEIEAIQDMQDKATSKFIF